MHEWLVARLAELGDYMRTEVENFLRNWEARSMQTAPSSESSSVPEPSELNWLEGANPGLQFGCRRPAIEFVGGGMPE